MNLEIYIDKIIDDGLDRNHWFMTKQTMSNYYFPYYIAYIVDTYKTKHKIDQNFSKYYLECFKNNPETRELFPKQSESENTYRNAIIAEFTGLIDRKDNQYANATATDAYKRLSAYVHEFSDVEKYRDIIDRQIEKVCLNVIRSRKFSDVEKVTLFPVVFLYKILLGLYDRYHDSKLTYEEFSLFVIRTKLYDDYSKTMDLIDQYRKHAYSNSYDAKISQIMNHQSTKNVRFDSMLGSLRHIEYKSNDYYRINNSQESYDYIRNVVSIFETSKWNGFWIKTSLKNLCKARNILKEQLTTYRFQIL